MNSGEDKSSQIFAMRRSDRSHFLWHLLASPVICAMGLGALLYWSNIQGLLFTTAIGIAFGYLTLLSGWIVFGRSHSRWWVSLALTATLYMFLTTACMLELGSWEAEFQAAVFAGNGAYFAAMLVAHLIFARLSRVSIQHKSHCDPSVTDELRYGIGELLMVTAATALLLAAGQVLTTEDTYDRPEFLSLFFALVVIGIFHFVIYWPILVATLSSQHRLSTIVLSMCVFTIAVVVEIYLFRHMGWGDGWHEIVVVTGLLNFPFAIVVIVHLAIVNRFGYRLMMKRRWLEQPESSQQERDMDESPRSDDTNFFSA